MFKRISGVPNLATFPKTASTAFPNGGAVTFGSGTGFVRPNVQTDPTVAGIIQQAIAASDGDYAQNTPVLIDQANNQENWEVDVINTLAVTDVGQYFKIASSDSSSVDASTRSSTFGAGFLAQGLVFNCVGFISPTKGLFKINSSSQNRPASS